MATRSRTIFRDGKVFAEYVDGQLVYLSPSYSPPNRSELAAPLVMRDIGEYKSPLDGSVITSRSQHRDHMRAHDVVEVGNEKIGNLTAAREREVPKVDIDLGQAIKHRLDEVAAMPQREYDHQVEIKQHEAAEVTSWITA